MFCPTAVLRSDRKECCHFMMRSLTPQQATGNALAIAVQVGKMGWFKKIIRFLFIGLWESTYRRKQHRELHSYHAFASPHRRHPLVYQSRYRWIRKGKGEPSQKD
jgi:hypothetical protein